MTKKPNWEAVYAEDRGHMSWVKDRDAPAGADSIALVGASEIDEEHKNVALIAAAPDLLQAAKDALASHSAGFFQSGETIEALRRAIRKAEDC